MCLNVKLMHIDFTDIFRDGTALRFILLLVVFEL